MNKDRIIHPLVNVPDTDDTKYDKYGRVAWVKNDKGVWNMKTHKDLKPSTPDGNMKDVDNLPSFAKGDKVRAVGKSLYGVPLDGIYYFDSYDSWDNTCFISKDKSGAICKWVSLTNIVLSDRSDAIKKMLKDKKDKK